MLSSEEHNLSDVSLHQALCHFAKLGKWHFNSGLIDYLWSGCEPNFLSSSSVELAGFQRLPICCGTKRQKPECVSTSVLLVHLLHEKVLSLLSATYVYMMIYMVSITTTSNKVFYMIRSVLYNCWRNRGSRWLGQGKGILLVTSLRRKATDVGMGIWSDADGNG